jgi:hypothetical protein
MSELIADLPYRLVDVGGEEYSVSVAGEPTMDGRWEGWLEYVPADESAPLITPTETTQATRSALVHWGETLTETYVQGAFARAAGAAAAPVGSRVVARRIGADEIATAITDTLPDPFQLFATGRTAMRAQLDALSRPSLFAIVSSYGLNPAGKSLAGFTDRQLVTFVITAVEAQLLSGKRRT